MRRQIADNIDYQEVEKQLKEFAAMPRSRTIRSVVRKLRGPLRKAKLNGATYVELASWLKERGIVCSPTTLKIYLTEMGRKDRSTQVSKTKKQGPNLPKRTPGVLPPVPIGFKVINDEEL